ncbi:MAG: phospho-sugar mutase [Bacilli bacterium]|jgi:phosphoglucomutase
MIMISDFELWKNHPGLPIDYRRELDELDELSRREAFATNIEFGTGGMRGIMGVGTNRINEYTIKWATMGLACFVVSRSCGPFKVAIAYDTRGDSKRFARVAAQTLGSYGIVAYLFKEPRPTPELSYAVRRLKAQAGIVITASHNPPIYNGYKIYDSQGCQFIPDLADRVSELMQGESDYLSRVLPSYEDLLSAGTIVEIDHEIDDPYLDFLTTLSPKSNNDGSFKIVYTPLHGTGAAFGALLLEKLGYEVHTVMAQMVPDPLFATVASPNPEDKRAFILAEELGHKINATLLMATDPDADRLGIAVWSQGQYRYLSGALLGALLLDYILKTRPSTQDDVLITTIVTPTLGQMIAKAHGIDVILTLTGFKFIGDQIARLPPSKRFLFGYEESYGFLFSGEVRDKDAFQGMAIASEMFAHYHKKKIDIGEVIASLYLTYGYFVDELLSYELRGLDGLATINRVMKSLRKQAATLFRDLKIHTYEDYLFSSGIDSKGRSYVLRLPVSDVVRLLGDHGSIVFRPSGTEPKLKVYLSFHYEDETEAKRMALLAKSIIDRFVKGFTENE